MPINVTLTVQVVEGPSLSALRTIEVDAHDKIQVKVEAGASNKIVDVQPGGAGRVQLLAITSTRFGDQLTYKVNNAGDAIKLDAEQLLMGAGAVGLLGGSPKTLSFTNNLAEEADVIILVGRKASA
jgi:hypothetical protein